MTAARIVLLACCALLCRADGPSIEQLYSEAVQLHQKGQIEAAVAKYRAVLARRPDFVPARSNLGAALARLGHLDEAIANYEQALRADPRNQAIRLNLALAYYKRAEFERAAVELVRVHSAEPANLQALYLLADCDLRLGRNKEVIALVEPAEAEHPDDRALTYLLGTALIRDGQLAKGQPVIDRIFRGGATPEANLLLGAAQLAAHDEKALATLTGALGQNPNLPGIYTLRGLARLQVSDFAGAKEDFRKALAADPNDFDANLRLGALLASDHQNDEATRHIDQALRVRPSSVEARFQRASIHVSLGRLEDACHEFESIVKDSPDFLEAHVQLAALYYRLNRREDGQRERAIVQKLTEEMRQKETKALADR